MGRNKLKFYFMEFRDRLPFFAGDQCLVKMKIKYKLLMSVVTISQSLFIFNFRKRQLILKQYRSCHITSARMLKNCLIQERKVGKIGVGLRLEWK